MEIKNYYLKPGFLFASKEAYLVRTVLGSCVSVCLHDRKKKYGAINHYIYDQPHGEKPTAIYGSVSIKYMLKLMIKFGSKMEDIDAYIVGGARSDNLKSSTVGSDNIEIAREILQKANISIKKFVHAGKSGKKISFNTYNGQIQIENIKK